MKKIFVLFFLLSGCQLYLEENQCAVLSTTDHVDRYTTMNYKGQRFSPTQGIKVLKSGEHSYDFCNIYKTEGGRRICVGSHIVSKNNLMNKFDQIDCPTNMDIIRDDAKPSED